MPVRNIVVVGGGFAGTALIRRLERRLPSDWQPVLVSEENYITFTPLLSEVVGASLLPGHAVAPIRRMLKRGRYYRARVRGIDRKEGILHCDDGSTHSIPFDHLVLAWGKVPDSSLIEGMADSALPLKTLGDALHIRNRMILSLERAELEPDPDRRKWLATYIIIGGGSSGVEVAGAIADFLVTASKVYPALQGTGFQVVLIESGKRLLAELPEPLGRYAMRLMADHQIDVRLDTQVSRVTDQGVRTEDGEWIGGANVIGTIGTAPNPLVKRLKLPDERGLIKTNPDMSVEGSDNLWAIGDCAAVLNAEDRTLSPPTAQFAVRQGRQLADNLARVVRGEVARPFSYRSRGQLATIGHRRAVAQLFGVTVSGFPAWLMWRAVYLLMLPTLLRKLQVFTEWNLDLLFPRDLTQLHLGRTSPARSDPDEG
jgi:NADH dehydrogenase